MIGFYSIIIYYDTFIYHNGTSILWLSVIIFLVRFLNFNIEIRLNNYVLKKYLSVGVQLNNRNMLTTVFGLTVIIMKMICITFLFLQLILEAILPCYLKHIQQPMYREIEKDVINQLIISIKTLINNSEALSKYASILYYNFFKLLMF